VPARRRRRCDWGSKGDAPGFRDVDAAIDTQGCVFLIQNDDLFAAYAVAERSILVQVEHGNARD
jgi:hypothetical protein